MINKLFGLLVLVNLLWIPFSFFRNNPNTLPSASQVVKTKPANTNINISRIVSDSSSDEVNVVTHFSFINLSTLKSTNFNSELKPVSIASMVKIFVALTIADQLDEGKLKLTDSIEELPEFADTDGQKGDNISQSLYFMLSPSSNSATNALILKAGGLTSINAYLVKNGITNSSMTCFLSPTSLEDNSCQSSNTATMTDLVKAITIIHKGKGPNFELLRKAMTTTDSKFSHTDRLYNKVGLNDTVLGNVGIIRVDNIDYAFSIVFDSPDKDASRYDDYTEPRLFEIPNNDINSKRDPISKAIQSFINQVRE
jgi:hypothetical protein